MEDYRTLDSKMDGQAYKAGHHAATLRRLLWREHLGLLPAQKLDASDDPNAQPPDVCGNDVMEGAEYDFVADPLDDQVWAMWTENATKNTELFRHLFRADPDDNSKRSNKCFILIFFSSFSPPPPSIYFLLNEGIQSLLLTFWVRTQQSKLLTTTRPSYQDTKNSSRATFTIPLCRQRKYGRNSIRSRAIWCGCPWTFSKMRKWRKRDWR